MSERQSVPQFRDQFEFTRYPFEDGEENEEVVQMTTTGGIVLDPDVFLDASFYPVGGVAPLYLSRVTVEPDVVELAISDASLTELATASFDPFVGPAILRFQDVYGRPAGIVVSELARLGRFTAWPAGTHAFAPTATRFASACVIPTPEVGVRGFITERGEILTGDVFIVGDNGVVVREDGEGIIRVDVVGDPLYRRKLCSPIDLFQTPNFVRTINGCPPDKYGNFHIVPGDHVAPRTAMRIFPRDGDICIVIVGDTIQGT